MGTLQDGDIVIVTPEHVGGPSEQLEIVRPERRLSVGGRQRFEGVEPRLVLKGLSALLRVRHSLTCPMRLVCRGRGRP